MGAPLDGEAHPVLLSIHAAPLDGVELLGVHRGVAGQALLLALVGPVPLELESVLRVGGQPVGQLLAAPLTVRGVAFQAGLVTHRLELAPVAAIPLQILAGRDHGGLPLGIHLAGLVASTAVDGVLSVQMDVVGEAVVAHPHVHLGHRSGDEVELGRVELPVAVAVGALVRHLQRRGLEHALPGVAPAVVDVAQEAVLLLPAALDLGRIGVRLGLGQEGVPVAHEVRVAARALLHGRAPVGLVAGPAALAPGQGRELGAVAVERARVALEQGRVGVVERARVDQGLADRGDEQGQGQGDRGDQDQDPGPDAQRGELTELDLAADPLVLVGLLVEEVLLLASELELEAVGPALDGDRQPAAADDQEVALLELRGAEDREAVAQGPGAAVQVLDREPAALPVVANLRVALGGDGVLDGDHAGRARADVDGVRVGLGQQLLAFLDGESGHGDSSRGGGDPA